MENNISKEKTIIQTIREQCNKGEAGYIVPNELLQNLLKEKGFKEIKTIQEKHIENDFQNNLKL